MPFCWEADPRTEDEGVVFAVDVTCHARAAGFESPTFVSRGVWVQFIGAGPGQEQRLVDTLAAAACNMSKPIKASDDGTAMLFRLRADGDTHVEVICVIDPKRDSVTFMLWREFARRPADAMLRVRVVAEDETRPRA